MRTGRDVLRSARRTGRRPLLLASALYCGHQVCEASVPVLIGVVVDRAIVHQDGGALFTWLGVLVAVFLVLTTCFRFGVRQAETASLMVRRDLALRMSARLLHPAGDARSRLPGVVVATATDDVARVAGVMHAIPWTVAAGAAILYVAGVLLSVSPVLGLVVLVVVPVLLFGVHRLGLPIERRSAAQQERAAAATGIAADLVAGVRVLKGIGAEAPAVDRYVECSRESLAATLRVTRAEAAFGGTVTAGSGVVLAVVALVAGRFAAEGEIGVGGLITAVGLAQFLIGPLGVIGGTSGEFAAARASAERIAQVLSGAPAVAQGSAQAAVPVRGLVRLRGLSCGPLPALDLDVAPEELVGLVVPDPAAAAALAQVLGRERTAEAGTLELDGVPLDSLDLAASRALLRVSPHDAGLFSGTLGENVAAGGPSTAAAIAAAQVEQIITDAPEGADVPVGERGRLLSGGQRQRVALARALAGDVPVLVLHDPTTAVDAVTEARIADGLRSVRAGRTTLVLTTSPALLAVCDRVVLHGPVPLEGAHAELLRHERYRATVLA